MAQINITRGFDIPMTGMARKELDILPDTQYVAVPVSYTHLTLPTN